MLRTIVENIADSVVITSEDGVVRYVNRAAEALLGRSAAELVGSIFGYPSEDSELELTVGGESRIGEMRVSSVEWDGRAARIAVIRDITERKRVSALERLLLLADRRSAIGQLAASIAHEINNPAAFILANLTVMRDVVEDFEGVFKEARLSQALLDKYHIGQSLDDMREMLKDNEMGLSRIRSFVRELKALSQEGPGRVERVHLNDVVELACGMSMSSPRVRLLRRLGEVPRIAGDWLKLAQAVLHLVSNAIHAVETGERGQGTVEVSTRANAEHVMVAVRDDGRGIPKEHLGKIFEPFFIANPGQNGIGLGLPVASEIAAGHRGRIEVTSKVGEGSEFRLVVPRDTGLVITDPSKSAAPGHVRARVLLIDDDARACRRVREMLEPFHDVVDAGGSARAIKHVARDRDFDVVLCDLAPAAADIKTLHKALAAAAPRLAARMVFLSSGGFSARTRRFIETTRAIVLEKPLSRALLCEVIERIGR